MPIASRTHTANYTTIGNDCLRAGDVTPEALGVFCYLRSMPPDWRVMPTQLANHFKCGLERIQRILKELISAGYVLKSRLRDPVTKAWKAVEYNVLGTRSPASEQVTASDMPAKPTEAKPYQGNPHVAFPALLNTDLPSTDLTRNNRIPERSASGRSDRSCRHGNEKPVPGYKQTKAESDRELDRLKRMPWRQDSGDEEFRPSPRAARGALVHWYRLLGKGHAANRIVRSAELFLQNLPDEDQVPCLARFLSAYAEECADPESDTFVPEHYHHDGSRAIETQEEFRP